MLTFTQKVPKWAHVCDWAKERSEGYVEIIQFGRRYFIPVTKEMKRVFGITRRGNKLTFKKGATELDAERFLRDIVGGLLGQVQHTVGDGIEETLSSQLTDFLKEKLEPSFEKMVSREMDDHLLLEGKDEHEESA